MSLKKFFKFFYIFPSFIIIIPSLFIPVIFSTFNINFSENNYLYESIYNSEFIWPIPGYTKISSPFGKRTSPTIGASTYHLGIDIPAPVGTNLIAPCDSVVSFIGFNGSGGYSIFLKSKNLEFIYHHVSPNYIISKGQIISKRSNYRSSRT